MLPSLLAMYICNSFEICVIATIDSYEHGKEDVGRLIPLRCFAGFLYLYLLSMNLSSMSIGYVHALPPSRPFSCFSTLPLLLSFAPPPFQHPHSPHSYSCRFTSGLAHALTPRKSPPLLTVLFSFFSFFPFFPSSYWVFDFLYFFFPKLDFYFGRAIPLILL